MHAWLIWIIVAAGLAGAEMLSLDFVLIMLAGGAAAGAVAAGVGVPPAVQVGVMQISGATAVVWQDEITR
jgi:membrane protein implicated in regulation of membrane protease activity